MCDYYFILIWWVVVREWVLGFVLIGFVYGCCLLVGFCGVLVMGVFISGMVAGLCACYVV